MHEMTYNELVQRINNNQLNFYNFYNIDISIPAYYTVKYFLENPQDSVDKKIDLSTFLLDIEVYTHHQALDEKFKEGEFPIASVSTYFDKSDKYKVFFLGEVSYDINKIITKLKEEQYIDSDTIDLEIFTFNDEKQLLIELWKYIRECDPVVLSGYNSDSFDYPYIYHRMLRLFGESNTKSIISKFGLVEERNKTLKIADYTIIDILYLLRPRSEGGRGYGKSRDSYSLDDVAKEELNIGKVTHDISLDELYESDKFTYLFYNLVDIILTSRLMKKLNHIQLHTILGRLMRCSISESLRGITVPIDTYIFSELSRQKKFIRYGINREKTITISPEDVKDIPTPKDKKRKFTLSKNINRETFLNLTSMYPGAYVKDPIPNLITNQLIIDLDASSLYPSMILQHNISFDSFIAQVLDPPIYKLLDLISNPLDKDILEKIFSNIFLYTKQYVDKGQFVNKTEAITNIYYILCYLLRKIVTYNRPVKNIFNPETNQDYIIQRTYLIPLINLLSVIHPENTQEYNSLIYDYLFNEKIIVSKYKYTYIYLYPFSSKSKIVKFQLNDAIDFLKKYCFTISGAVFYKHNDKLGLFTNIILDLRELRTKYKSLRDSHPPDSPEYEYYNNMQDSVKVNMNSIYGAFGLSVFRYSSSYLAKAITCQGRTVNKIAQYLAERYLQLKYQN